MHPVVEYCPFQNLGAPEWRTKSMLKKIKLQFLILFFAGFITAGLLAWLVMDSETAHADQYSCIRQDLDATGMTGNIPDPEFTITYQIPSCYTTNGYKVQRVYMYGSQVAVHYARSNN